MLVSAFIAGGPPSRVVEEVVAGRLELVLAEPVLAELERVLTGKLGFERRRWEEVESFLVERAAERVGTSAGPPEAITGDRADDAILACAVAADAVAVVSGDRRHLHPVGEHRGVRVLSPQALLAELRRR